MIRHSFKITVITTCLIFAAVGCGGGGSSAGPRIHDITYDPAGSVSPGSDVKVTADVEGTDLEYQWTVDGGLVRKASFHQGQAGPGIPKIAVTPSGHDNAGKVVGSMGFDYDTLNVEVLSNAGVIGAYDVVFINSSDAISVTGTEIALKNWVEDGGSLYLSGTAADYLIELGIDSITFAKPEPYIGSANTEGELRGGTVLDPSMIDGTGFSELDLQYPDYPWAPIIDTDWPASILLEANMTGLFDTGSITNLPTGFDIAHTPYSVSIPYGKGQILYTTFHDHPGMKHDEVTLSLYLAALAVTWPIVSDARDLIELTGYYPYIDYIGMMSEGETVEKEFTLTGYENVILSINAAVGIYKIDVSGPGGLTKSLTAPVPVSMTFPSVEDGDWSVTLKAEDTGDLENVPYVLSVGVKSETSTIITQSPEVIWTVPSAPGIYTVRLKVIDSEFRTDEFLSGIKVK